MTTAKVLDCTLRDGAYLIDKNFGDETIKGIISGLVKAGIDYIEVGFFQDEGFDEGKTVFKNSADVKRYIPKDKNGCLFTVLADYSRFSIDNLDECVPDSIDGFRECFFKEERFGALEVCKVAKERGYKVFVQPVDILGYSDLELIEFIDEVNKIEPYCISIVDTFGSMYQEELLHSFEIINYNLISTCKIGFHSHNNMQMSNALSQEFIRIANGKRSVIVDGTLSGMGRGAGNTPTELIVQYLIKHSDAHFNIDAILDVIDNYIDNLRTRCSWGYNTEYFIAGCYGAHVNNIQYLVSKASIQSKDIRYILNKIGQLPRKRYDYDLLEKSYLEYLQSVVDDSEAFEELETTLSGRRVLIIAPGASARFESNRIDDYIAKHNPVVIAINFWDEKIRIDYVYMSNKKRYTACACDENFKQYKKIIASNIKSVSDNENEIIVSFNKLVKCGWEHMDNSAILLLRLLDMIPGILSIGIAGLDGYDSCTREGNYRSNELEKSSVKESYASINEEIRSMLDDYRVTRCSKDVDIEFVTSSRFETVFIGE